MTGLEPIRIRTGSKSKRTDASYGRPKKAPLRKGAFLIKDAVEKTSAASPGTNSHPKSPAAMYAPAIFKFLVGCAYTIRGHTLFHMNHFVSSQSPYETFHLFESQPQNQTATEHNGIRRQKSFNYSILLHIF